MKKIIGDKAIKRQPVYLGPMRWEAVLKRIPENIEITGVEIGVLLGETAFRILSQRPLVKHFMVDPWVVQPRDSAFVKSGDNCSKKPQSYHNTAYDYTVKRMIQFGKRAKILRLYSRDAAPLFPNSSLDYVFIDGDHSYEGVKNDILLWLPKIKKGGWIGFHDYGMIVNPRVTGVKQAVSEYFHDRIIEEDVEDTAFIRV